MELQTRSFECRASDTGSRTIELSFASEMPVDRGDYLEILSCREGEADLSRINDGAHPLLLNHSLDAQLGVVERAWIADGKCRAKVRFGKSQLATEVFQDVKDGIRKLVSVGYKLKKLLSESRNEQGIAVSKFSWAAHEISIVPIPADASVGIGRSLERSQIVMSEKFNTAEEINAIARNLAGKVENVEQLAAEAILRNESVDSFRSRALNQMNLKPAATFSTSELRPKDWARYSLARACVTQGRDGIEAEVSQEIALRSGKAAQGFFVPNEIFATRSHVAGTNTLGGFLVNTQTMGSEFIEALRNHAKVLQLGARTMQLSGPVTIPRQSGTGTVNWVGETVASTLSATNFTSLSLTPRRVTAWQQYSKSLLIQSNPSIDEIVKNDILSEIALKIDLAALHGAGGDEPTGICNTSGINTVAIAASGLSLNNATAYPFLISLETKLAQSNVDFSRVSYLFRPEHRAALKKQQRFTSTDSPVWTSVEGKDGAYSGRVCGYNSEVSNQLATNLTQGTATTICSVAIMGAWDQLIVAEWGATDVVSDIYSYADRGVVRILASKFVDCGIRLPQAFCVGGGLLSP